MVGKVGKGNFYLLFKQMILKLEKLESFLKRVELAHIGKRLTLVTRF